MLGASLAVADCLQCRNAKELIEMAKQTQATDVEVTFVLQNLLYHVNCFFCVGQAMMRMQRMINESEETGMETNIKLKTQVRTFRAETFIQELLPFVSFVKVSFAD